jgi:signal transduction histidine kinase
MTGTASPKVRRTATPQSRTQFLVGLTAVLAVAFAVGAWRTARTQKHKVEEATCFFAADAARVLQGRSLAYLDAVTEPIFASVGGRASLASAMTLAPPLALKRADEAIRRCHCTPELSVRAYFRLDINPDGTPGALLVEPGVPSQATGTPGAPAHALRQQHGGIISVSLDRSPKLNSGVTLEGLPVSADQLRDAILRVASLFGDGGVLAAAVTNSETDTDTLRAVALLSPKFGTNGQLRAVYGLLVAPTDFVAELIVPVFDRVFVFPYMLVWRGHALRASNRDMANLAVYDNRYTRLYQNGPMADTAASAPGCNGMSPPDPALAQVMLHLSPPRAVSDEWTAASMATSELPFLGAILLGMLASVVATALAARRQGELARLRSDFVSSVSHELRMPLAQILLSGETLSLGRTRSQAERDDAADAIVREAHRLAGLVDNALLFSQVEHHNLILQPAPEDLSVLAAQAANAVVPLAEGAGAVVASSVQPGLGAMVDRDAVRQVLYNLLENAIKYGGAGQRISIGGVPSASESGRVRIWVEDEGSGIPPGQETAIFEPFVRLKRDRDVRVAGTGLGLAVVRYIVDALGGRVWVERRRGGRGSRFVVDLPAATVASASPIADQSDSARDDRRHDAAS